MTIYTTWESYLASQQDAYLDSENLADCTDVIYLNEKQCCIFGSTRLWAFAAESNGNVIIATGCSSVESFLDYLTYRDEGFFRWLMEDKPWDSYTAMALITAAPDWSYLDDCWRKVLDVLDIDPDSVDNFDDLLTMEGIEDAAAEKWAEYFATIEKED